MKTLLPFSVLWFLTISLHAQKADIPDFHFEGMTMAVNNMDRMLEFYSAVFQIQFEEKEMFNSRLYQGKWGDLDLLFCPAEVAQNRAEQNRHQFDIVVKDLDKLVNLAQNAGGKLMGAIAEDETGLSVGIYDPDNNSILFKQYRPDGGPAKKKQVIYKQIDTVALKMDIYFPEQMEADSSYPAMVYFFGGGWNGGNVRQFEPHAAYFSSRGIVCFLADYRVKNRQQTSPFESLKDAKSAIRFIRTHAETYHIDTARIIASGGSAGGHLAAATALTTGYNEETDDRSISCIPNALVLFNPVIDNGPGGYGYDRIGERYQSFSPLHNIRRGAPPTIFFLGTEDRLIPVETARYYQTVMEKVGSRCELFLYEGQGHGFFNHNRPGNYYKTVLETDRFLRSLDYLQGEPKLKLAVETE